MRIHPAHIGLPALLGLWLVLPLEGASGGSPVAVEETPSVSEEEDSLAAFDTAFDLALEPRGISRDAVPLTAQQSRFGAGEELRYQVKFGMLKAGSASMRVEEIFRLDGQAAYRLISLVQSGGPFGALHKVDDRVESWLDPYRLRSLGYSKRLREGDFKRDEEVRFHYDLGIARDGKGREQPIGPSVQDMLSALYTIRTLDLQVGRPLTMEAYSGGKRYDLEVRVLREERADTPAGKFDCLVVEPLLQSGGIFEQKGRLTLWLAKDLDFAPVVMKSKIKVGTITMELNGYRPKDDPAEAGREGTASLP